MNPLYVSFFTPDYADCALALVASLEKFELDHSVEAVESRGSWVGNAGMKPEFIWRKMDEAAGRPVVWLDADCVVRRNPEELNRGLQAAADIAAVVWSRPGRSDAELLSGTLWFPATVAGRRLVDAWIELQAQLPNKWDQVTLMMAVEKLNSRLAVLPIEYCWIFDTHARLFPGRQPIIEHYQHSRTARK